MKKIVVSILSFLMILGTTSIEVAALDDEDVLTEDVIETVDEHITRQGSFLSISDNEELKNELNSEEYNLALLNINYTNKLIENGIIGVKTNGSLYIIGEDNLVIQGGNINATRLYWWGWHRYNDNKNTKKIISDFKKQVSYSDSKIAQKIFNGLNNVPGGFVITSIPSLINGSLKGFANELSRKNKGYGTIIAANWIVIGSNIKSQSKNTK